MPLPRALAILALATALPGCAAVMVADAATDAVVFTGKTAVRGTVAAGSLVTRGAAAGVRTLTAPTEQFPAGTTVCLDNDGNAYAAARVENGEAFCPDPT